MTGSYHIPVMLDEVLSWLITDRSGVYVDATFGGGGHAAEVLSAIAASGGRLFGFDADAGAIANARVRFAEEIDASLIVRQAYFSQACRLLRDEQIRPTGVLLDLGVSSRQLDSDQIGLSYRTEMPLDMRFDQQSDRVSARHIVGEYSAEQLATLMRQYGEEPAAWKIAQEIVASRQSEPIETTVDLRNAIARAIPDRFLTKTLSRVFQALRIAVNDELGELQSALEQFIDLMVPGGRIVVLTYHSLEDRLVKEQFRKDEGTRLLPSELDTRETVVKRIRILTRKPIVPSNEEVALNPRARSAKLRVAEKL